MILKKTETFLVAARAAAIIPLILATYADFALAHDDEAHCSEVEKSVADAGFADVAKVECKDGTATITSNTYPNHTLMTGIVGTNEQVPVPAKDYAAQFPWHLFWAIRRKPAMPPWVSQSMAFRFMIIPAAAR